MSQNRSAVEIARSMLGMLYPDATEEGLSEAAQLVVRWGSEGLGNDLDAELSETLAEDLADIAGSSARSDDFVGESHRGQAPHRRWRLPRTGRGGAVPD
ncbi:hypothetical protein [Kitasatospora sp. NPDC050543]|uniref:hypothetical protein n=1 Tax=Kitasatospora sp. NPDC050543 TaxID=3364054 RepID=UPI003797119F